MRVLNKKLLIALDGSNHSKNAVKKIINIYLSMKDCELHIIHVFQKSPNISDLKHANFNVSELLRQKATTILRPLLLLLEESRCPYHLEIAIGDPAEEIISYAKELQPLMVIVGSRGLNTLGEVLLGSVSHKVVHDSSFPVLVVK